MAFCFFCLRDCFTRNAVDPRCILGTVVELFFVEEKCFWSFFSSKKKFLYRPYTDPIPTIYQLYTGLYRPIPTLYRPHTDAIPILYRPIPTVYRPYTAPLPILYQAYTDLYRPYTDPTPSLCRLYTSPTPSLYRPYTVPIRSLSLSWI